MSNSVDFDPFARFRSATRARIGLGRAGDAMPTQAVLEFQLAHARARDAVHGEVDFEKLATALAPIETVLVHSLAKDRATYLTRPDLGRMPDRRDLPAPGNTYEIAFIIADGLSAAAVERHAVSVYEATVRRLGGFSVAPVILGKQARVAFGDEAAAAFGAQVAIVLIGERPGLSVPDSLGAYITFEPRKGRRDSERNCISNIHDDGLSYESAAEKISWLVKEALRLKLSGVDLKENAVDGISLPHGAKSLT
ncbi:MULTISPECIES: ethanolamine ammonia-lyase subunit EutC [Rhizobium/Agrobacterium group]|uniref:ethanolamine ammonia-lyase subunit EutC n=1 Tax=Rhizobium/Agrobacterium group TaxID=227290 RepID=UPI000B3FC2B6|nr:MULTISPECIES: ethanolamine ammonia-lyase subunit EutC [Rhizobium/Agrobacterium group]MCF1480690.1 ethanolamine ammonia-lyase subunit EutC [Allorhizobium ampelinum]NSZ44542.1 ethanolamine ammonia-lyase subunit EutC [Agrobacterium vitis]NTA28289.1 ethanolamine ammonia-lyase subunit EutC [Allorhizobium ampelinum]OVE92928.1 ethanolamine ammonia-lyase [Allorhizobium ampelinum]